MLDRAGSTSEADTLVIALVAATGITAFSLRKELVGVKRRDNAGFRVRADAISGCYQLSAPVVFSIVPSAPGIGSRRFRAV